MAFAADEGEDLVEVGELYHCAGFDDDGNEQCRYVVRIMGVCPHTSGGQWARADFICADDACWPWWVSAPRESGGFGPALYRFCVNEYCAARAPRSATAMHAHDLTVIRTEESADLFLKFEKSDPTSEWPADLGEEPLEEGE